VVFYGCLIVAIILHEISHGVVALWFGDDTAKREGRLTLNPIPHIDLFGSIILPALMVFTTGFAFGYAKPVPVNPTKLRDPRRQMVFVGLAGPFSNFLLMFLAAVPVHVFTNGKYAYLTSWNDPPLIVQILMWFAFANLILGVFNMLPIPPLDGSALIERVLPRKWLPNWYRFRPYGMAVLFFLIFWTNALGVILRPFEEHFWKFVLG